MQIYVPVQPREWPLRTWQQLILLLYACFFAFYLPFLCWGSLDAPGHAHAHAHFIFAEPPEDTGIGSSHAHTHVHVSAVAGGAQHGQVADDVNPLLDARSVPEMSSASIFLLLLLELWVLYLSFLYQFPQRLSTHFSYSAFLPILLPPPRLSALPGNCI